MAEWKKIIVSGSQAELAGVTGSFTGSFIGDGSGLTGLTAAAITTYTNAADNRVITSVNATTVNSEANLTFNGSTLGVTGTILVDELGGISGSFDTIHLGNYNGDDIDSRINGFGTENYILQSDGAIEINHPIIKLTGIPTGTDNSVVVWTGTTLATDEIDPKVWAGNLVDKQGTPVQFQVAIFNDSDTLVGSSNFTFNDSTLSVTGNVDASGPITGSNLMLDGTLADGAGETTVLVIDSSGNVKSDEIDPRVWGATLVDGSELATNYVTFASDADTITGASDFTYVPGTKLLTVTNATITGDLVVQGTTTELQVTNLSVEDQFILLGSGSGEGDDKGIIFDNIGGGGTGTGAAFFYDADVNRLSYAFAVAANATAVTPAAYIPLVFDVEGASHTAVEDVGNIKIESGEAYIYV